MKPSGEHLVDVSLVAHVEEQLILWGIEDRVQRQRQLDHAQIRPQVAAGFGERLNQEYANLLGQLRHLRKVQALQIGGRVNRLKQRSHRLPSPEKCRAASNIPLKPGTGKPVSPTDSIPTRRIQALSG
jgi:hypothetical protein